MTLMGPPLPLKIFRQLLNITSPWKRKQRRSSAGGGQGQEAEKKRKKKKKKTHPEVGDGQRLPGAGEDHVDQVLAVGRHEGAVVWRQTHGLGLLVAHSVSRVQPHHVARVGLVQRHQVELQTHGGRRITFIL